MGLLERLGKHGISIWLMGGKLRVFPKPLLTQELRQWISQNREGLVLELEEAESELHLPYFNSSSTLVIPFNSPKRYHWWAGGQSIEDTIRELESGDTHWNQAIAKHGNPASWNGRSAIVDNPTREEADTHD